MQIAIRAAQIEDVAAVVALVNQFAARDLMLPRTEAAVARALPDWLVAEVAAGGAVEEGAAAGEPCSGARLVGCGALVTLSDSLAEIRSLAVHESQQGQGLGGRLVQALVEQAQARDFAQVCALTLRESFFVKLGFVVVDRWSISPKLWQECIYCPKFHRCDEVAVLLTLDGRPAAAGRSDPTRAANWHTLLKWSAWQPLKLAYNQEPARGHGARPQETAGDEER